MRSSTKVTVLAYGGPDVPVCARLPFPASCHSCCPFAALTGQLFSALGIFTADDAFLDIDVVRGGYNRARFLRAVKKKLVRAVSR